MFSHMRIPGQLPGEKVLKVIRRTWFVLFKKVLISFILLSLPYLFFQIIYPNFFSNIENYQIGYPVFILGTSAYYLFMWLFFFFAFIDYYLDVWIITNERIIDIKQEGFFSRTIAEQRLSRMQDVTSEVKGFFPTILGFGNIYVQTAAEKERFIFNEIPHPDAVRDLLIRLGEEAAPFTHP